MGLNYNEFWSSTPRSFSNRRRGYLKNKQENDRLSWEQTRYTAYYSMAIHMDSKKRQSMQKTLPLPWDVGKPLRKTTIKDTHKLLNKWLKAYPV